MADAHQPLHISYSDDRGGNKINKVTGIYGNTNLHKVWDSGILKKAKGGRSWRTYAATLLAEIKDENLTYDQMVFSDVYMQESYDIATSPAAQYCVWKKKKCRRIGDERVLGQDYHDIHQPVVEKRLKLAAVRLAGWFAVAID